MTIKEVEQHTGLPRSVVRFYEKEGLIAPRRGGENGYRDYQEEDVALLTRIAFLRSLDVPIADIARVLNGQAQLADVAAAQALALEERACAADEAAALCRRLAKNAPQRIDELDVSRYVGQPDAYARKRPGALARDCAAFARWFASARAFCLLLALTALLALWAYPRLPQEMPVQWSGGEVSGTAPRAAVFACPLLCLALRFGLRGQIERRLFGALGAYAHEMSGCIVNTGCLLALVLVGFTALYAVGLAHSGTALIAVVAALLVLLGVALVRGW